MKNDQNQLTMGELLRERAIKAVGLSNDVFMRAADKAIRAVALNHETFTTDLVWFCLDDWGYSTEEPRALGAAMRVAQKDDIIYPTDSWELSIRPACHRRPLRVWRSLIKRK